MFFVLQACAHSAISAFGAWELVILYANNYFGPDFRRVSFSMTLCKTFPPPLGSCKVQRFVVATIRWPCPIGPCLWFLALQLVKILELGLNLAQNLIVKSWLLNSQEPPYANTSLVNMRNIYIPAQVARKYNSNSIVPHPVWWILHNKWISVTNQLMGAMLSVGSDLWFRNICEGKNNSIISLFSDRAFARSWIEAFRAEITIGNIIDWICRQTKKQTTD